MFPNWTGWKTTKLILTIIAGAAGGVVAKQIDPTVTQVATWIGGVDATILALVVVMSGTSMGPQIVKMLPLALLFFLGGCSSAQQQAVVPASSELAVCVIPDVVGCALATPPTPWPACVAKVVVDCKTDEQSVISIWAAHKNAMLKEADAGVSYP